MRRIIHNTTAIAACLSLMAPHLAMAQTAAPGSEATQQPANEAAGMQAAPAETCEDGSAPPCEAAAEPAPAAEEAPAEEAPAEEPAEEPAAEKAPEAEAEPAPEGQDGFAGSEPEAAAEEAPAEEAPAEPEAEPETALEPAPEESAPAEEPPAEAPEATDSPADPPAEEAPAEAEPANDNAGFSSESAPAPAAEAPVPNAEAPAAEANATTDAPADGEAKSDADALKDALAAEEAKNNPDAAAKPEATDEAAPAAEEKPAEGLAEKAPEENAKETEAAKEAAEATAPAAAAALNADASEAEVTEEEVTEDNSRSSAEDFATNLRDALEGNSEQQQASNDDDDDDDNNDLVKALLLGGAGVAVGAMLANNRQVALSSPDRVVVTRSDGSQQVIKDEVALLRQPGSTVTTENFSDGSSRTIVNRADGSQVVTIRDANLRVLRRTLVSADGTERQLIDDTTAEPVDVSSLPAPAATSTTSASQMDEAALRTALMSQSAADRRFTLSQIRDIAQVRSLVAPVNIDSITFDTGSAAIKADQAEQLSALGNVIRDSIAENPGEMFMIEGYTDTVGADAANLALSDRRAESVALALSEYFDVPPENMVVQGYGEQFLMVNEEGDVRENRRASVRRITELLQTASN